MVDLFRAKELRVSQVGGGAGGRGGKAAYCTAAPIIYSCYLTMGGGTLLWDSGTGLSRCRRVAAHLLVCQVRIDRCRLLIEGTRLPGSIVRDPFHRL